LSLLLDISEHHRNDRKSSLDCLSVAVWLFFTVSEFSSSRSFREEQGSPATCDQQHSRRVNRCPFFRRLRPLQGVSLLVHFLRIGKLSVCLSIIGLSRYPIIVVCFVKQQSSGCFVNRSSRQFRMPTKKMNIKN
jgi:hypothetical protein